MRSSAFDSSFSARSPHTHLSSKLAPSAFSSLMYLQHVPCWRPLRFPQLRGSSFIDYEIIRRGKALLMTQFIQHLLGFALEYQSQLFKQFVCTHEELIPAHHEHSLAASRPRVWTVLPAFRSDFAPFSMPSPFPPPRSTSMSTKMVMACSGFVRALLNDRLRCTSTRFRVNAWHAERAPAFELCHSMRVRVGY